MDRRMRLIAALIGLSMFWLCLNGNVGAQPAPLKIGDEAPSFTLPSSQDKLVDYYADYYGKHHLIITFFPAAFTPV